MVKILMAGGGTLGSVSPLLAIKESLPVADYLFVGTRKGPERKFIQHHGIRYSFIGVCKFRRYISISNLVDLIKFPFIVIEALYIVSRYKPNIILTAGGFTSVPIGIAGRLRGVPVFMHQQDIRVGLANKILARFASVITTTFVEQNKNFPSKKVHTTGNPVRQLTGQQQDPKNIILILGGSLGAQHMNAMVNQIIPDLSKKYTVVHVLGQKNFYQRLSLPHNYIPVQFLAEDYLSYLQRAKMVITRGGMGTITELAQFKKPSVLIPIPNTQQVDNALFLKKYDAVRYVHQDNTQELNDAVTEILNDTATAKRLGHNLSKLFPSDANKKYVQIIQQYLTEIPLEHPIAYFVGIGGIGTSSLVHYFRNLNYEIVGSDLARNAVTRRLTAEGITIHLEHNKHNIPKNTSVVIYSSAVPENNEEILEARRRHIAMYSYSEYLGFISKQKMTIAVTGTHGKTTTTAMTGFLLQETLDPTVIVGSFVPQFGDKNYRHGQGEVLIVEADDYRSHMLSINPNTIIMTNIDTDHLDYFRDIEDIQMNFQNFAEKLPSHGILIKNDDDPHLKTITAKNMITYGFNSQADYRAQRLKVHGGFQIFDVYHKNRKLETFQIRLPGLFNVSNALASITAAISLHQDLTLMKQRLHKFKGSWRRLELVGTYHGSPVISDYAHHPTAIKASLAAIREFYPEKNILLVFQPHSFDRTKKLFKDFIQVLQLADVLILTEIYDALGRDSIDRMSSKDLFAEIKHKNAYYAIDNEEVHSTIKKTLSSKDLILIMGAGNIDDVARTIIKE